MDTSPTEATAVDYDRLVALLALFSTPVTPIPHLESGLTPEWREMHGHLAICVAFGAEYPNAPHDPAYQLQNARECALHYVLEKTAGLVSLEMVADHVIGPDTSARHSLEDAYDCVQADLDGGMAQTLLFFTPAQVEKIAGLDIEEVNALLPSLEAKLHNVEIQAAAGLTYETPEARAALRERYHGLAKLLGNSLLNLRRNVLWDILPAKDGCVDVIFHCHPGLVLGALRLGEIFDAAEAAEAALSLRLSETGMPILRTHPDQVVMTEGAPVPLVDFIRETLAKPLWLSGQAMDEYLRQHYEAKQQQR